MEIDQHQQDAIDKLRAATEDEKLPRKVRDVLENLDADEFQAASDEVRERAEKLREQITELEEQADALETRADSIGNFSERIGEAVDGVDEWEGAEGREDKADARESLMNALVSVVEAFDEIDEEDGDDVIDSEVKAFDAEIDRLAHVAVAGCLEDGMQAAIQAVTIGMDEGQRRGVELAADYFYKQHLFAGEEPIDGE